MSKTCSPFTKTYKVYLIFNWVAASCWIMSLMSTVKMCYNKCYISVIVFVVQLCLYTYYKQITLPISYKYSSHRFRFHQMYKTLYSSRGSRCFFFGSFNTIQSAFLYTIAYFTLVLSFVLPENPFGLIYA